MAPPPSRLPTLVESTRLLLDECDLNNNQLAKATGLNYFWIRKFRKGYISRPGADFVETLNRYLTSQKKHA